MSRDALTGAHKQLAETSLMTYQNRLALDFPLAEHGSVCSLFGPDWCEYLPNDTSPDGCFAAALNRPTAMSEELAEHSGIENPFMTWLGKTFGQWEALVTPVLISIVAPLYQVLLCLLAVNYTPTSGLTLM